MNAPISLYDAVWNIAGAKAASPLPWVCWSTLVDMFLDGELTATGRIGDPTNDHSPIPREAWPHIRPRDVLWFDPVETITGRPIFDVSVYWVGKFAAPAIVVRAGTCAPPRGGTCAAPADAASVEDDMVNAGGILAAARWIVERDQVFAVSDLAAALDAFGLGLADDGTIVSTLGDTTAGGQRRASSGRRPSLGLALATAKASLIAENDEAVKPPTIARDAVAWLASHAPTVEVPSVSSVARAIYRTHARQPDEGEDSPKSCG